MTRRASFFRAIALSASLLGLAACSGGGSNAAEEIIQSIAPTAAFNVSVASGPAPLTVTFTDVSAAGSGVISGWSWNFGDGQTSTARSPSHTYSATGSYDVALTVTTPIGSHTLTVPGAVTVTQTSGSGAATCVWNQAYQENFVVDDVADIQANASHCYVLVDPMPPADAEVAAAIPAIKANTNEVGCYISIGTGEDWRDDFDALKPYLVSKEWPEWPGEFYVRTVTTGVEPIMKARIDTLATMGCDWVEFDNMDWALYDDVRTSFGITATAEEGKTYFNNLCDHVRSHGMKCMSKGTREGAEGFEGVLFESTSGEAEWWDQADLAAFLSEGKLSIINHYNEPDCDGAYAAFQARYGNDLSFICESTVTRAYVHFNQW